MAMVIYAEPSKSDSAHTAMEAHASGLSYSHASNGLAKARRSSKLAARK